MANQLCDSVQLFDAQNVSKYIAPVSLQLLIDKVAAVRQAALQLVST